MRESTEKDGFDPLVEFGDPGIEVGEPFEVESIDLRRINEESDCGLEVWKEGLAWEEGKRERGEEPTHDLLDLVENDGESLGGVEAGSELVHESEDVLVGVDKGVGLVLKGERG